MNRRGWISLGVVVFFLTASAVIGTIARQPTAQVGRPEPFDQDVHDESVAGTQGGRSLESRSAPGLAITAPDQPAADPAPDTLPQTGPQIPEAPGTKVVKTASVEVKIADGTFQSKFARAGSVAEQFGGFVSHSSTSETKGKISSGTIVIRVPADKFQAALTELKALGEVTADSQTGTDVTAEFVDLEARLRHLRTQETFYLKLMNEAKSISDMISIQERLSSVQSQIEQIQGRLQYLNDQTSFSTINARIFEPSAAPAQPKGLGKAFTEAWNAFRTVAGHMVVGAGWLAPFALLGLLGWGTWRVLKRRPRVAPAE